MGLVGCTAATRVDDAAARTPAPVGLEEEITYDPPPREFKGLPLLYVDDFEFSNKAKFVITNPESWSFERDGRRSVFAFRTILGPEQPYKPEYRSPISRATIEGMRVSDFVFDVWMRSTVPDNPHRDMCLFFGYRNPREFYYVHLGLVGDAVSNQIHIVNNADRAPITRKSSPGTPWTDDYHHARVVRDATSGLIEVYFDDMSTPIMTAMDRTFSSGRVGFGSFDDGGHIDRAVLWGRLAD